MAKTRLINTKFWSDNFIVELDPLEKLLFLYFLTNEHTNVAGVYELPLKVMAFETGINKEMLEKMMPRFENKVYFLDGWVFIRNFNKNQKMNQSMLEGAKKCIAEVPKEIMAKIKGIEQGVDRVGTGSDISIFKYESILESKSISKPESIKRAKPAENSINGIFDLFYKSVNPTINFGNKTNRKAVQDLIRQFGLKDTIEFTRLAISVQGKKFAPVITTPYQLKEKLGQLKVYFDQQEVNKPRIIKI